MKERRIKIIIVLMTIALLGLMGFQYYLIQNLLIVEQERFDRLVSEALNSVVVQIDRQEALAEDPLGARGSGHSGGRSGRGDEPERRKGERRPG